MYRKGLALLKQVESAIDVYSLKKFTADTEDLIDHNEWGVGLENLLNDLYEIEFPLDRKAVDLARTRSKNVKWTMTSGHLLKSC